MLLLFAPLFFGYLKVGHEKIEKTFFFKFTPRSLFHFRSPTYCIIGMVVRIEQYHQLKIMFVGIQTGGKLSSIFLVRKTLELVKVQNGIKYLRLQLRLKYAQGWY